MPVFTWVTTEASIPVAPRNGRGEHTGAPEDGPGAPEEDSRHPIKAPLVGTFYRAPQPGADPFVKVGDIVVAGSEWGRVRALIDELDLVTRDELDELELRVAQLEHRLRLLETPPEA